MRTRAAVGHGNKALASLGNLWCRAMHDDVAWPVQGHYRCRRCNRVYEIPWEESPPAQPSEALRELAHSALKAAKPASIAA